MGKVIPMWWCGECNGMNTPCLHKRTAIGWYETNEQEDDHVQNQEL